MLLMCLKRQDVSAVEQDSFCQAKVIQECSDQSQGLLKAIESGNKRLLREECDSLQVGQYLALYSSHNLNNSTGNIARANSNSKKMKLEKTSIICRVRVLYFTCQFLTETVGSQNGTICYAGITEQSCERVFFSREYVIVCFVNGLLSVLGCRSVLSFS